MEEQKFLKRRLKSYRSTQNKNRMMQNSRNKRKEEQEKERRHLRNEKKRKIRALLFRPLMRTD